MVKGCPFSLTNSSPAGRRPFVAHHDHSPRRKKKNDVPGGDQHIGGIVITQFLLLVFKTVKDRNGRAERTRCPARLRPDAGPLSSRSGMPSSFPASLLQSPHRQFSPTNNTCGGLCSTRQDALPHHSCREMHQSRIFSVDPAVEHIPEVLGKELNSPFSRRPEPFWRSSYRRTTAGSGRGSTMASVRQV